MSFIIDTDIYFPLSTSMQSIQNLGLALIAMAAGAILDSRGYLVLEVFFCACICSQYFLLVCLCAYEIFFLLLCDAFTNVHFT